MKKIFLKFFLICAIFFSWVCVVCAGESSYYARLTTKVSSNSTGKGLVYASTTISDDGIVYAVSSSSDVQESVNEPGAEKMFYAFAQPANGCYFKGWSSSDNSETILSASNPYPVVVATSTAANGTNESRLFAVFKANPSVTITYATPVNGSYTASYSDQQISVTPTAGGGQSKTSQETVTLTATPAEGYKFLQWVKTVGGVKSAFASTSTVSVGFPSDATVCAEFVDIHLAVFRVNGAYFADLNEADRYASSQGGALIVLAQDGLLPEGNYQLSASNQLLIPCDAKALFHSQPVINPATMIQRLPVMSVFRKLTFDPNASLTLKGSLCVDAQMSSLAGGEASGCPAGPCGVIDLSHGGHIELQKGAVLYCWGFIVGQDQYHGNNTQGVGTITVGSGATVWEDFAIGDWRGGTSSSNIVNNHLTW